MTDLLERLRAANPIPDCTQPDFEHFSQILDEESAVRSPLSGYRDSGAAGWRGALGRTRLVRLASAVAVVAAALAIVALASRSGDGISLVQRAYAATDPAGGIIYYATSTRSSFRSGAKTSSSESRAQVWRSGSRSRRVEVTVTHLRDGQAQQGGSYEQASERIARGEVSSSYSSRTNTVFKGLLTFRGSTSPESINCRLSPACSLTTEDPVVALRELYAAGRVHEAGHAQLNGETLTVLQVGSLWRTQPAPLRFIRLIPSARILVDPKTGAPVELTTRYGQQLGALTSTTIFHTYQHLKLTPQTSRLLTARAHPSARIECVPALHCSANNGPPNR
jgi:hypothetical protein